MHQSSATTLTIAEADDVSTPVVTPTGCSGVVTIASGLTQGTWTSSTMGSLSGTITLLALASGTCSLQISDGNGHSQTITLIASASGSITEFASTPLSANVISLVSGGDGNLWAIESNNKLAKITTAGALTEFSLALSQPAIDITYGSDGNLWILEGATNTTTTTLAKVSTSGTLLTQLNPAFSGTPSAIVAGGDGNLYLPECDFPNSNYAYPFLDSQMATVTTAGTMSEHVMYAHNNVAHSGCFGPGPWGAGGVTRTATGAVGMTLVGTYQDWFNDGNTETYANAIYSATGSTSASQFNSNVGALANGVSPATSAASSTFRNITTDSSGNIWIIFNAISLNIPCDCTITINQGAWLTNGSGGIGQPILQPTYSVVGDSNGNLWLGEGTHIMKYQVSSRGVTTYSQGITSAQVMVVGPDGNIWYAGNKVFGYISP